MKLISLSNWWCRALYGIGIVWATVGLLNYQNFWGATVGYFGIILVGVGSYRRSDKDK